MHRHFCSHCRSVITLVMDESGKCQGDADHEDSLCEGCALMQSGFEESSDLSGKRFPISLDDQRSICREVPESIPWEAISAHESEARANHGQSLDALAQRGGLSPYELLAVLFDRSFWRCGLPEPGTVIKKAEREDDGFLTLTRR
jgi:hypothetical protein